MDYLSKYFGIGRGRMKMVEEDDFSEFFAVKFTEKVKIIREVMREATAEQEIVIKRYRGKQIA